MVTGVVHSSPRFLPSIFIAHRVQQSHCSSIFHRVLVTHALEFSASQFVHRKKSPRIYTSTHSSSDRQSSQFCKFFFSLEAVGVREYCCMAVENRLAALRFTRYPRETRAPRATNPRPSGLVTMLFSRDPPKRGVALSREPPKLQQA